MPSPSLPSASTSPQNSNVTINTFFDQLEYSPSGKKGEMLMSSVSALAEPFEWDSLDNEKKVKLSFLISRGLSKERMEKHKDMIKESLDGTTQLGKSCTSS
jgi:hypothetical protein